jgi:hypothetical protein
MPSAYLAGSDLATYGVPNATAQQILNASLLIDAYLPAGRLAVAA